MPRIAAAIGVFSTLIFCVGFNVVQYPAVWRMVAASTVPSQPSQAAETPVSAQSPAAARPVPITVPQRDSRTPAEALSKPAPAVPAMAASMPRVKPVCEGGVCQLPSSPTAEQSTKGVAGGVDRAAPIGWPKDPPPAAKKTSVAKQAKPSQAVARKTASSAPEKAAQPGAKSQPRVTATGNSGLVPVVRSAKAATTAPDTALGPTGETVASQADAEQKIVRRLPPIDNSLPPTLSDDPVASDAHIPIYPSTTVR